MNVYACQIVCAILFSIVLYLTLARLKFMDLLFYVISKSLTRLYRGEMTLGDSLLMRILLIVKFEVDREIFANKISLPKLVSVSLKCVDAGLSPPSSGELRIIATDMNINTTNEYLDSCVKVVFSILALRVIYTYKRCTRNVYLGYIFDYLNEYEGS